MPATQVTARERMMAGALDGVRVIDFGQYIAGPLAAMFLADHGADVIRVDPPGGPRWDTPANATWNRGKRSIVLDLKRDDDRRIAERLIASADIVIENFRPGVMDRLGLGAQAMTDANPGLIYCSLPGFASDDPRASLPAWEGVVAAATDTYRAARGADGATPTFTAIPIASTYAAILAGIAIGSALYSRERDGRGQRIEVPLFDATFAAIGASGLSVQGEAGGGRPDDFGGGNFQCADGRWVMLSLAKPRFQERFVRTAGLADRFDPERIGTDKAIRDALRAEFPVIFKTRTADEWEAVGVEADVPLLKIRSAEEWMESEHARLSESVFELDDEQYGPMAQPNSPFRLSLTGARPNRPAPVMDADRDAILAELDALGARKTGSGANGSKPAPRHAALEGVKVVDLSQVLAGPTGGRTLGEFGADVVKVNPPDEEGAGIRFSVHRYHTDVNRAKRTMLLDLKAPGGLDVMWRLLDDADVVVHNFRPGVMERLGIGYEEASKRRQGIIYVSVTAYGAGPWGSRPGYEGFGQASTGVAVRQGGEGRPAGQPFAVNDYGTGLSSAFAATLALFHRERTGQGQQGAAALAYTGTILQSPYLQLYEGKKWDEPKGPAARGFGPLQCLYRASDGWFYLGARKSELAALADVDGLAGIDALSGDALTATLDERFATASVAAWCDRLTARGIGAHRLVGVPELMNDPWVVAHGLSVTREHDTGEVITTVGPPVRMSATPVDVGRAAASPGADGLEVLSSIGMADEAERLEAAGAFWREPVPVD
jgi:crotonobetainyl-CoA:carnitine CoA-transferase CaiB-like acyl-CoA transferase